MIEPDLTPEEVCLTYKISMPTLRRWRREGVGPVYRKLGRQTVRYPAKTTREFFDATIQQSTAEDSHSDRGKVGGRGGVRLNP